MRRPSAGFDFAHRFLSFTFPDLLHGKLKPGSAPGFSGKGAATQFTEKTVPVTSGPGGVPT